MDDTIEKVKIDEMNYIFLTPELKEELIQEYLAELTVERLKNDSGITYSLEEIREEFGIDVNSEEYKNIPMEYGVDFE